MDEVDEARLRTWVLSLEGARHPVTAPERLLQTEERIAAAFAELGLPTNREPFPFRGREFRNVVGTLPGDDPGHPWLLLGAHLDTVPGTPGADDNASGLAVLIEVARILRRARLGATLQLVAFNLEEPQGPGWRYRIGSACFAAAARRRGARYAGALILEMVGYTSAGPARQQVPWLLFWKRLPAQASFLAVTGDGQSRRLLRRFAGSVRRHVPELPLVTHRTPLRGFLVPATRLSDNASFWDRGYPALMITDTAFLRNPHYHMPTDRSDTLDFPFMARVARGVIASLVDLATLSLSAQGYGSPCGGIGAGEPPARV